MAYGTADLVRNTAVVDITATTTPNGQTTAKAQVVVGVNPATGGVLGTAASPMVTTASGTGASANQVQGNAPSGDVDSGNPVKVGGVVRAAAPAGMADGTRFDLRLDTYGNVRAVPVLNQLPGQDAFPNGNVGGASPTTSTDALMQMVAAMVCNGTSWDRLKKPSAVTRIASSAASTNATVVKASAGDVFNVAAYNSNVAVRFLKLYNQATSPVVGTDTPVLTLALPPLSAISVPLQSQYFSAGIAIALTTGAADADTSAVGAGDILGLNVSYQ